MRVIVTDAFWHDGRLVQESRYEDEMEVEAEKEEEEEEAPDWGGEEEEVGAHTGCCPRMRSRVVVAWRPWRDGTPRGTPSSRGAFGPPGTRPCRRRPPPLHILCLLRWQGRGARACRVRPRVAHPPEHLCAHASHPPTRAPLSPPYCTPPGLQGASRRGGGEEEPLDAEEEVPFSDSLDRERYVLSAVPLFTSPQASAYDGAVMLLGAVVDLAAAPAPSDLQLLASWAAGSGNVAAAAYLLAALHALGEGPLKGQVPGAVLEELSSQLAEVCTAQVRAAACPCLPRVARRALPCPVQGPPGGRGAGRSCLHGLAQACSIPPGQQHTAWLRACAGSQPLTHHPLARTHARTHTYTPPPTTTPHPTTTPCRAWTPRAWCRSCSRTSCPTPRGRTRWAAPTRTCLPSPSDHLPLTF